MGSRISSPLAEGESQFRPLVERQERSAKTSRPQNYRFGRRQSGLRRTKIKRVSKGLKAEQAKYFKLSAAFLAQPENRFCIICIVRREHGENILINFATEVHHFAGRIKRLLCYVPYFKPSCRHCRDWPHENKSKARLWGLLAPITKWNVFPSSGDNLQN